ncbi:MAG: hypothetical protein RJA70_4215 [Pseudomonadota bacterium]
MLARPAHRVRRSEPQRQGQFAAAELGEVGFLVPTWGRFRRSCPVVLDQRRYCGGQETLSRYWRLDCLRCCASREAGESDHIFLEPRGVTCASDS